MLLGATAGAFGSALATIAMAWVLVRANASPILITLLYACASAPQLILGLPAGVLGDRLGHRVTVFISGSGAAIVLAILSVIGWLGTLPVLLVLVAALLLAAADTVRQTNLQPLAGRTSRRGMLSMAPLNAVTTAALLAGAVIGGGLFTFIGPGWVIALGATAHALAAYALRPPVFVDPWPTETTSEPPKPGLRSGLLLMARQPMVRDLAIVVVGVETCLFSTVAVLPTFTHEVLGGGPASLGLLTGCFNGGGLLVLSALTVLATVPYSRLLFWSLVIGSLALLAESGTAYIAGACAALVILGGSLACIDTASQTLMQLLAPGDQRGAVAGLWMVAVGCAPVGQLGCGLIVSWLGVRPALAVFGASALLLGAAVRRLPLFSGVQEGQVKG